MTKIIIIILGIVIVLIILIGIWFLPKAGIDTSQIFKIQSTTTNNYDNKKIANEVLKDLNVLLSYNGSDYTWDENKINQDILNSRIKYFENKYSEVDGDTRKFYDVDIYLRWCMEPNLEIIQGAETGNFLKCKKEWNEIGHRIIGTVSKNIEIKNNNVSGQGDVIVRAWYTHETNGSIIRFGN